MILLMFCVLQLLTTHGSIILDLPGQIDRDEMKYCEIGGCEEGSHIMCVSYRPHEEMGPSCADGRKVDFKEDTKKYILNLVNGFRMRAARGEETGKDGEPLPKAYLMNKLKWDDGLAKFAQVLADTCILRNDMCRASEKFHNPGQYGGFMRFTYPDWQFLSKKRPPTDKSLTIEKILHAINAVINGIYQFKKYATKALIESHGERNIYMTLVYGWSTHIGCGMSTYVDYHPADNALFNTLLFFCNFSHQPSAESYDGKVYETEDTTTSTTTSTTTPTTTTTTTTTIPTTPTDTIPTTTTRYPTYPTLPKNETDSTTSSTSETTPATIGYKICKPVVAIMPIFQVDNAPQDKLDELEGKKLLGNAVLRRLTSDCMNSPHDYLHTPLRPLPKKNYMMTTSERLRQKVLNQYSVTVRARYSEGTSTLVPPLIPRSIGPETEFEDYFVSMLESLSSNTTQYDKNGFLYTTLYEPRRQHLRRHKYTIRRRQFDQPWTTPWTRKTFKASPDHDHAHGTINKGNPSFVKKESVFLRAPRFQVQNVKYSGRIRNLPAKNGHPNTPRPKNPLYMKKFPTRRTKAGISRRNMTHLAKLVSDYSSHKRCLLDKLNNVFKN